MIEKSAQGADFSTVLDTLEGTVVPEPATRFLLGLGAVIV
jgi:hypothetical protein